MAQKNSTILAKMWLEGTNDFQQRIPEPSQHGITATMDALFDPMNNQCYNQFMSILLNRIGLTYVHQREWTNPLSGFKTGKLEYGSTIQEIAPKWITAHSYTDSTETLLKMNRPDAAQWFHSVNREDRYDISITRDELRQAFTEETGLNTLIAGVLQSVINSAQYDEYIIMKQLIAEYENRWGFFKCNLSEAPTTETAGKEFLTKVRTYVGKLRFPSTLYNASNLEDIPVFANPEELILLVTPEVAANLSVEVLASLFHIEEADINVKQVIIDEFPIEGAQALLTTQDWFVCKDVVNEMQQWFNPQTLTQQNYYHIWQVISCSPFVPAILFTTDAGTTVNSITENVTGITLTATKDTIKAGEEVALSVALTGTVDPEGEGAMLAPNSATYEISIKDATINSRTYVDRLGVLHTQKSLETGDVITVTAKATYINPSGATSVFTNNVTINVDNG